MGGGLMQLVAYGAQDIYLTGNPQITFFKVVYRRHTNFSMETIKQTMDGNATASGISDITIARNGDLITKIYLTSTNSSTVQGSALINQVELEIGGQMIDRHYAEWNQIWWELTTPMQDATAFKAMICDSGICSGEHGYLGMLQVPLNFWFCRNPGLALPLIALQYHEVKLKITWGSTAADFTTPPKIWCDYIYLDTDERRRFAQVSHEYLIDQVQRQSCKASTKQDLTFNHPVKELIWTSLDDNSKHYTNAKLVLNGADRFEKQEEEYFQLRQPYEYHTTTPINNLNHHLHDMITPKALGVDITGDNYTTELLVADDVVGVNSDAVDNANTLVTGTFAVTTSTVYEDRDSDFNGNPLAKTSPGYVADMSYQRIVLSFLAADLTITGLIPGISQVLIHYKDTGHSSHGSHIFSINGTVEAVKVGPGGSTKYSSALHHLVMKPSTAAGAHSPSLFRQRKSLVGAEIPQLTITSIITNGSTVKDNREAYTSKFDKKVNVYSFALKPEEHQPSGTCNFSRIDSAELITGTALDNADNIYAVNYNVLRIMSGMGGLAFSN